MSGDLLTLTEADAGRTVRIRLGDHIQLRLAENPTTGYRWTADAPAGLRLVQDTNLPVACAPGAGGLRLLDYVAEAPGSIALVLRCQRQWEGADSAIVTFSLTIEVQ